MWPTRPWTHCKWAAMSDALQQFEHWLAPLLASLGPAQMRQLTRTVALRLRAANQQSMAAQQSPDGQAWEPRKPRRTRDAKGSLRTGAMFRKLRTSRHLRASVQGPAAVVQFMGRAERLARIHHFGLRDRVSPGGAEYDYPARELIGISDAQLDAITDLALAHLAQDY